MKVDSYKFLPRSFRPGFESAPIAESTPVWSPLRCPLPEARVALLTSAGLYLRSSQESFDLEREKREPHWGDPTYRILPQSMRQEEVDAAHLHINTRDLKVDYNVALPLRAFAALADEGTIGSLANENYSFMGFQAEGTVEWRNTYGPQVAERLKQQQVDALVLAPA